MRHLLLSCFCLLLTAASLHAQSVRNTDPLPSPHFAERPVNASIYGVDEGLSQGLIFSMAMDRYGRLWLATKDGLNCYDGRTFRTYRHEPNNANSMAHDKLLSLAIDTLGMLWLVYATGDLGLLDPSTETFELLHTSTGSNYNFKEIQRMPDGRMLLKNENSGFHSLHFIASLQQGDGPQARLHLQALAAEFPKVPKPGYAQEIRSFRVCFANDGTFWMANLDSVYRYGTLPDSPDPVWSAFNMPQRSPEVPEQYVNFIADLDGSTAYVVDADLVLQRYDAQRNVFVPMLRLPRDTYLTGGAFLDRRNRLYYFHNNSELLRIHTRDATCERLLLQWNRSFPHRNFQLRTTLEDAQGNVWMGTPGSGLVQINHNNDRFTAYKQPFTSYQRGLYQYRITRPGNKPHHDADAMRAWDAFRREHFPEAVFSQRLGLDLMGNYWSGSIESDAYSLLRMDAATGHAEVVFAEAPGAHHFGHHFFMGRDGRVWVNTRLPGMPAGLWSYEPLSGKTATYAIPPLPTFGDYPGISDVHETPEGHWWLATTDGLFFFNPGSGYWRQFRHLPDDSTSLSGNLTLSICPDPATPGRYLWIGTEGNGLNRFDLRDSTFSHFNTTHGLPNNVVYGILPDHHNNLWISTNQGLSHFYVKEGRFVNYNASHGLAGNEFNRYEYAADDAGKLYFGGTAGLTVVEPEHFYKATQPSQTLITGLKVQNAPVRYHRDNPGLLEAPIHATRHLVLPHDHRMFALEFANLDLSVPAENTFRYMLEGFDKDWIEAGTATEATYTNLNPGHYVFKVLGRNSFRVWQSEPTTLSIHILTPWWATWWFRAFVLLLVATALYGLYRYRLNSLLGMERLRNSIAQDLHDEIGSTLSSISLYSAVMQKSSTALPQNTHAILNKIIDSTSEIMEKMSDMVWTIKSDNDHFDQVVRRMRAFAANVTDSQNVALHFDADPGVEALRLDMDQRKNIYLIYKEAVINASKYSGCKTLRIHLRKVGKDVELTVSDDGCGFDLQASNANEGLLGGNGISGMQSRQSQCHVLYRLRPGTWHHRPACLAAKPLKPMIASGPVNP